MKKILFATMFILGGLFSKAQNNIQAIINNNSSSSVVVYEYINTNNNGNFSYVQQISIASGQNWSGTLYNGAPMGNFKFDIDANSPITCYDNNGYSYRGVASNNISFWYTDDQADNGYELDIEDGN